MLLPLGIGPVPVERLARWKPENVDLDAAVGPAQTTLEARLVCRQERQDSRLKSPERVNSLIWHVDGLNEQHS